MKRLMLWIIDHQRISLAVIAVATVLLVTQAVRLEIDVGVQALIVKDSPEWAYYEEIKERFGSDNLTAVVVSADTIFAAPVLQAVERLTTTIERLDGVTRVDSLTSVNSIKGEEDWVDTGPLIDGEVPTTAAEIERLRADALANPILVGNVISADARAAGLLVYVDGDDDDKRFDRRLAAALEGVIDQERERSGLNIYQIGRPYIRASLSEYIVRDQKVLLPVSLVVLIGVLYGLFRMPEAAVIPMTTSLLSVVWAFGWMGLLGYPVNILSGVLPVLLICVGFTEDVHLISEYQRLRKQGQPKLEALRTTIDELASPLLVTSLTTAVGFASLSISDIEILRQLGHIVPLGFASNLLITIVLVPAMLCSWPDRKRARQPTSSERGGLPFESLLDGLGRFNLRHRGAVILGATALLAVGAVGGPLLQADNDLLQFFRPSAPLRQRVEAIHETLAGALTFNVVVEANELGAAKQPNFLGHVAALQEFLESSPDVDKTISIADYVRTMHHQMNGGDDAFAVIPDSPELIAQYLTLLHDADVSRYIDYDYASASISVRHNLGSTAEMDLFLDGLERYARSELPGTLTVRHTGETILLGDAADYLATNMVTGLVYTVLVVTLINAVFFMSIKAGLLSLIPNLLPIAFIVGLMGLVGVPLNVGTTMIAAVAVGIAIDDTVHYMARNSLELDRGHDQAAAMFSTLAAEGRAIIATSIGLTAGFSVLVFSSFTPIAYFGAMSAIVMIVAVLTDLTLTPVLMASTRLVTLWNIVLMKLDRELLETPLFRNLSQWQARKVVLLGMLLKLGRNDYAIHQGDREDTLYMVVTGRLFVSRDAGEGEKVLATLYPGDVFGEMALVDKMARSASVIAAQDSEVLRLNAADLDRLRRRFPRTALKIFENISRLLSTRLRDTTRGVERAREEHAA